MSEAYSREYREIARQAGAELGIDLRESVYAGMLGPSYETPAEIHFLRTIGAGLVGMSTVPEAIVANHMGMKVLAISSVTNMAAGLRGPQAGSPGSAGRWDTGAGHADPVAGRGDS